MIDDYNKILCDVLHKQVVIEQNPMKGGVKNKILKTGIFKNWKCNPFFMEWVIDTDKGEETVKMFYPFKCESYSDDDEFETNSIFFDFRISTFNKIMQTNFDQKLVEKYNSHKYIESIIILEVIK